jgi:hypothetical protein
MGAAAGAIVAGYNSANGILAQLTRLFANVNMELIERKWATKLLYQPFAKRVC